MSLHNPTLFVTFPDGSKLPVQDTTKLGRSDFEGFAQLDELNLISSKHFTLFKEGNLYYLVDGVEGQKSENGTMLNGQDISNLGKQPLRSGDAISVADVLVLNIHIE